MNEQKQTNLPHKYGKKIAGVLRSNACVFTAVMWTGASSQSSPYPKSSPTPLAHPLAPIHGITVLNFHYEILSDSKTVAKRGGESKIPYIQLPQMLTSYLTTVQ